MPPTLTYCTIAQFSEAVPTFVISDEASLTEVLFTAERDVDMALGVRGRNLTTGLRVNLTGLSDYRVKALARAVAFQAEYRLVKGDEFFIHSRPESQTGPDGSVVGQEPFIAPKASQELAYGNFYRLTSGRGWRNLYDIPNQNVDQEPW